MIEVGAILAQHLEISGSFHDPYISRPFTQYLQQIFSVSALSQRFCEFCQIIGVYEPLTESDFLGTGDLQALPGFDDLDELGCLQQALVRSGIWGQANPRPNFSTLSWPIAR